MSEPTIKIKKIGKILSCGTDITTLYGTDITALYNTYPSTEYTLKRIIR